MYSVYCNIRYYYVCYSINLRSMTIAYRFGVLRLSRSLNNAAAVRQSGTDSLLPFWPETIAVNWQGDVYSKTLMKALAR